MKQYLPKLEKKYNCRLYIAHNAIDRPDTPILHIVWEGGMRDTAGLDDENNISDPLRYLDGVIRAYKENIWKRIRDLSNPNLFPS